MIISISYVFVAVVLLVMAALFLAIRGEIRKRKAERKSYAEEFAGTLTRFLQTRGYLVAYTNPPGDMRRMFVERRGRQLAVDASTIGQNRLYASYPPFELKINASSSIEQAEIAAQLIEALFEDMSKKP